MTKPKKGEENLKGTLYSVFGLLAIIIIFWGAVFGLFVERF